METNVKKILLRGLITLFSIILIIIMNSYLDYRFELLTARNEIVKESGSSYEDQRMNIRAVWDRYSPTNVNLEIIGIARDEDENEKIESSY